MENPNGCHNQPRPTVHTAILAQDGWITTGAPGTPSFSRLPRMVLVPHAMTTDCQYTKTTIDAKCNGCAHQESIIQLT